ncbi:MAG: DUF5683 domain-containing protein [Tannerella sp.]|jgi:hypothetical protein|nr:DUF5683 domain-containing protein [Tannerella sp.]
MGKDTYLKPIRFILWMLCFLPTGIAATIRAHDTIPGTNNLLPSNATILQPGDTLFSSPAPKDTLLREQTSSPGDTLIPSPGNRTVTLPHDYGILHPDSILLYANDTLPLLTPPDSTPAMRRLKNRDHTAKKDAVAFKPNPKTAYLIAAVFPGFGQAYNRQYWKLPIVYGGLAGFMYAITWNNKVYQDYRKAYFDMRTDYNRYREDPDQYGPDTWSTSWQNYFGKNANNLLNQNNHTRLQKGRDYYRRYRDLSIILSIAFYAVCIADAYVDAQMFDFDISPDLSFRIAPEVYPPTLANARSFGLNICMTF